MKSEAHHLVKRIHERAQLKLKEKKELRLPMRMVKREVSIYLGCKCGCGIPGIEPTDSTPYPPERAQTTECGFRCNSGRCILSSWQCDNYSDCDGGEDEAGTIPYTSLLRDGKLIFGGEQRRDQDECLSYTSLGGHFCPFLPIFAHFSQFSAIVNKIFVSKIFSGQIFFKDP